MAANPMATPVGAGRMVFDRPAQLRVALSHPLLKLLLLGFAWAYLHHFCAGVRYLLLDLHKGIALPAARQSSVIVLVVSLALTLIVGARLW